MAEILYKVISEYWSQHLEVIFVADGDFKNIFKNIVDFHGFHNRVSICDYREKLARLAYAASDFVLMPSIFEPCGLPQMIGMRYGSIPIAHDTGGLHDTIEHLDSRKDTGNGFLFEIHDPNGLFWAIGQAIQFYHLPSQVRQTTIARIMRQSISMFNHTATARQYIELYEKMLQRPLIDPTYRITASDRRDRRHQNGLTGFSNLLSRPQDTCHHGYRQPSGDGSAKGQNG
jgi:starch synthase/alpha-amylase